MSIVDAKLFVCDSWNATTLFFSRVGAPTVMTSRAGGGGDSLLCALGRGARGRYVGGKGGMKKPGAGPGFIS